MKRAWLVLVLAACSSSSGDDYPVGGGQSPPVHNDGGGSGVKDAGVGDGGLLDGGVLVTGRVCLLDDLRKLGDRTACAKTGVDKLTVSLGLGPKTSAGTRTATTTADGSFSLIAAVDAGFTWHVTGPTSGANALTPTAMLYGTDNLIPVIRATLYQDNAGEGGVQISATSASVVARVVRGTAGVSNLVAAASAAPGLTTLYDAGGTGAIQTWDTDVTSGRGIVWLPGIELGQAATSTSVTLTQSGTAIATRTLPLEQGTITFATIELPPISQ